MKYSDYYSKNKSSSSSTFYIIIAVGLLIIGSFVWMARSRMTDRNKRFNESGNNNSAYSSSSASSNLSSIISDGMNDIKNGLKGNNNSDGRGTNSTSSVPSVASERVDNNVSDQPYSSDLSSGSSSDTADRQKTVFSTPVEGKIIKKFSNNELQYSATYGDMRMHNGIDISCKEGTAVSAVADGSVVSVENSTEWGTVVTINHSGGITVKYSSVSDPSVKSGDEVSAGDIIGVSGIIPCECADDAHIHIEITENGEFVDWSAFN